MAAALFSETNAARGHDVFKIDGFEIRSLTEFVIFHEASHLIHNENVDLFKRTIALYKEAQKLIPPALIKSGRIITEPHGDFEFSANAFAYENTRADIGEVDECR
jgi:hypothetical protein